MENGGNNIFWEKGEQEFRKKVEATKVYHIILETVRRKPLSLGGLPYEAERKICHIL